MANLAGRVLLCTLPAWSKKHTDAFNPMLLVGDFAVVVHARMNGLHTGITDKIVFSCMLPGEYHVQGRDMLNGSCTPMAKDKYAFYHMPFRRVELQVPFCITGSVSVIKNADVQTSCTRMRLVSAIWEVLRDWSRAHV